MAAMKGTGPTPAGGEFAAAVRSVRSCGPLSQERKTGSAAERPRQKLERMTSPEMLYLHGARAGPLVRPCRHSASSELEKQVPPPRLGIPTFPGAELVSHGDPTGPAGHDITRHHGSGSGGLAPGMGHAWLKLDAWEGEVSARELWAEAGGWSPRRSGVTDPRPATPALVATFGERQTAVWKEG